MAFDKKTLMSIFIAFIMIVSVIGFSLTFAEPPEQLEYNGYKFVRTNQGLRTEIKDTNIFFYYFPRDIENIKVNEGAKTALQEARVIWTTYDPADLNAKEISDALYYIEDALNTVSDTYVQRGLLNSTGYVLPEITCKNATTTVPVITIMTSNETKISHENGCVTATAETAQDIYRIGDRILYQLLGVMN